MAVPSWIYDAANTCWDLFHRYFLYYFLVSGVGERWAMFNNLMGYFLICIALIYGAKPWGLKKWNRNVVNNKRRLRALAFQKLGQELEKCDEKQKNDRRRISGLSFAQLRDELQQGRISAVQAVDAYRWKSLESQEKYNCVVEFIKEAPTWAQQLDHQYKGRPKPPLFGMPFSVKENFCLNGYDCSRALAKELEWPVKEECSLVTHLRSLGAIPLIRTTVPQGMLSYMCSSPAYGTTLNPYDITRTSGGSSGGECAIIASGGCPFGIGSDIAGSMRIPAHFCGVTTLKPTSGRLRATGTRPGVPGIMKLGWSCGFFTKQTADQETLFQYTLVPEYFARVPQCVPLPLEPSNGERLPLRIGYYVEDGWFPSTAACKRAVLKAKRILEDAGHQLIPVAIPDPELAMRLILKCLFPDNGAYYLKNMEHEDVDPNLKITQRLLSFPLWLRWLATRLSAPIDRKSSIVIGAYVKNLADIRATSQEVDAYLKEFFEYWTELKLDAVVGTVMPFPAVQHHYPTKLSQAIFGTGIYNLLDLPSGVVPITNVTENDEAEMKNYPDPVSVKRFVQHPMYKMVRKAMIGSVGLPVGVQVMTLPFREELCLHVMKIIENGK